MHFSTVLGLVIISLWYFFPSLLLNRRWCVLCCVDSVRFNESRKTCIQNDIQSISGKVNINTMHQFACFELSVEKNLSFHCLLRMNLLFSKNPNDKRTKWKIRMIICRLGNELWFNQKTYSTVVRFN